MGEGVEVVGDWVFGVDAEGLFPAAEDFGHGHVGADGVAVGAIVEVHDDVVGGEDLLFGEGCVLDVGLGEHGVIIACMRIDIVTLFPEMFGGPFGESILKRAQEKGLVELYVHQLRDWAKDKHKMTDDRPFGGGPGMVLMPEPLFACVEELQDRYGNEKTQVILMAPSGEMFKHSVARELSESEHLIMVCGRYEGVDQRVIDHLVDREISIGEYVVSGGELPAMVVTDAIVRLLPGVLGNAESLASESHTQEGEMDYPVYTQPAVFRGWEVPEVLRSGNHGAIEEWRKVSSKRDNKNESI